MENRCYLSVVIITYNKLTYLKAVLSNLTHLTVTNDVEFVIVNDGSTDKSKEFLENLEFPYKVKIINTPNGGSAIARNTGIKNSCGEFVLFVDNDIILEHNYFKKLILYTKKNPDCVHAGNIGLISIKNVPKIINKLCSGKTLLKTDLSKISYLDAIYGTLPIAFKNDANKDISCWWGLVTGGNMCFPRKMLDILDGFDESFKSWGPEDIDLTFRAFKMGFKFKFHNDLALFHLDHERNLLRVKQAMAKNVSLLLKKYKKSKEIIAYVNFFNGMMSLNDFNKICSQDNNNLQTINLEEHYINLDYYIKKGQMINWKKYDND
jgi:GT2 family glycosyltransferase